MRGLDAWLDRGLDRLDDEPEPLHPEDASLLASEPEYCEHRVTVGECILCHVQAECGRDWLAQALDVMRQAEDEAMGAALAARFGRG